MYCSSIILEANPCRVFAAIIERMFKSCLSMGSLVLCG